MKHKAEFKKIHGMTALLIDDALVGWVLRGINESWVHKVAGSNWVSRRYKNEQKARSALAYYITMGEEPPIVQKMLLKREEIGACRGCGASSEGVKLRGRFNPHGTLLTGDGGWHLAVTHVVDYVSKGGFNRGQMEHIEDRVAEIQCPKCYEEASKCIMAVFNDEIIQ